MGSRRVLVSVVLAMALGLAGVHAAIAAGTHVYSVSLTLKADSSKRRITGTVVTKAPSEFCDTSKIRVRQVQAGKDHVVAKVKPHNAKWHLDSTGSLRGKRVYAEVSRYHLPNRPVECRAARSPTVTAP